MKKILVLLVLLFPLAAQAKAPVMSEEVLCARMKAAVQDIAVKNRQKYPDNNDEMSVTCASKTVDIGHSSPLKQSEITSEWRREWQGLWNDSNCQRGSDFRRAIQHGWNIVSIYNFADGKHESVTAYCTK